MTPVESSSPIWTPQSWQSKPALQQPAYDDPHELDAVLCELATLPPLVTSYEVVQLKSQLAEAQAGKRFILQGGDCAESFADCNGYSISAKLKILLQMSLVLVQGSKKPVTRIARIAGQYAKPRSEDTETRNGITLPCYRGDIINRPAFTPNDRRNDPRQLLRGYERAALTLNFLRSLVKGGFADLHHPEYWDLSFAQDSPLEGEYHRMTAGIGEAVLFMENILGIRASEIERVDLFVSHEGLHLSYEQAQTRRVPRREGWFNLSTHFPWIGLRTAQPGGAHVEYFRGIENPIGIKVGHNTDAGTLLELTGKLNPANVPGRLTLIHRFGAGRIEQSLPAMIRTVRDSGRQVLWICDPMHGNTFLTSGGIKTRSFDDILKELELAFDIHAAQGSNLGGVHIELTGDNVTECTGGARGLTESDLMRAYRTEVDPRLNYEQALEIAMLLARKMARHPR
ncbi:MAG TPA: 3-deoxy-7-phosphoheptulonate synthase class II [Bryobacteraceae bacterium]|nr:3-deoxy-7-phosphoheptulonate synthase class II [Bryobacteraceae bacterium]